MKRWKVFGAIVFAAVVAASHPFAVLVLRPYTWSPTLLATCVVAACAHLALFAPSPRRGVRIALLCALLCLPAAWLSFPVALALVASAFATCRSGFLFRMAPARALFSELAFTGGGLFLATLLGSFTLLGVSLGLWTFFLVQALFLAVGGQEARVSHSALDPFEAARRRALRVLEQA